MEYKDITMPIYEGMLNYDPDPRFKREITSTASAKDPDKYGMSLLHLSSHNGTHVDAPAHFREGGGGVDTISLDVLCGPARVLDLSGEGLEITKDVLAGKDLDGKKRILLRTKMSEKLRPPLEENYAHLTVDGAEFLRNKGVELIGIDYLSIETYPSPGFPVHHKLLCDDPSMVIVEGLNLDKITEGNYELFCLPLPIVGCDGAPARVILGMP